MGYLMHAYAGDGAFTRVITITSVGNYQYKIDQQTPSASGVITTLSMAFANAKKPASVIFTWKPDKDVPASLFLKLFSGEFALELRVVEAASRNASELNFYRCKLIRHGSAGNGEVKIEASYMSFQ